MRLSRPPRRPAVVVLLAVALGIAGVVLVANASISALSGPLPSGPATVSILSPTSGLSAGSVVTFTASTTGGATLSGAVVAHVCATPPGGPIDNSNDFGYQGTYCVKQAGIIGGSLTGGDYSVQMSFAGVTTTNPPLNFKAGTGTVTWIDDLSGLHTLTCNDNNPCDLVIQVNFNQSPNTTYFTQSLTFGAGPTTTQSPTTTAAATTTTGAVTTTTGAVTTTTGAVTTTTGAVTTTTRAVTTTTLAPTTTAAATTTTAKAPTTTSAFATTTTGAASTSTTTAPSVTTTTLPIVVSGATTSTGGGALAFTGRNTRDLVSGGLLLIAAGLLLIAQLRRRRAAA
jgi:hypothetical protein